MNGNWHISIGRSLVSGGSKVFELFASFFNHDGFEIVAQV